MCFWTGHPCLCCPLQQFLVRSYHPILRSIFHRFSLMYFVSISIMTMVYLCPLLDCTGRLQYVQCRLFPSCPKFYNPNHFSFYGWLRLDFYSHCHLLIYQSVHSFILLTGPPVSDTSYDPFGYLLTP